jgi:hypothetical protein
VAAFARMCRFESGLGHKKNPRKYFGDFFLNDKKPAIIYGVKPLDADDDLLLKT